MPIDAWSRALTALQERRRTARQDDGATSHPPHHGLLRLVDALLLSAMPADGPARPWPEARGMARSALMGLLREGLEGLDLPVVRAAFGRLYRMAQEEEEREEVVGMVMERLSGHRPAREVVGVLLSSGMGTMGALAIVDRYWTEEVGLFDYIDYYREWHRCASLFDYIDYSDSYK